MRRGAVALALALAAATPATTRAGVRPAWGGTIKVAVPPAAGVASEEERLLVLRAIASPLLELDRDGNLRPGLLAEVPAPEAGGRAFRLRLRPGLRAASGAAVGAEQLAAHLAALLGREVTPCAPAAPQGCTHADVDGPAPSSSAWISLPILGTEDFRGSPEPLAGIQVLSETELLVTLAFPLPEFPWSLAAPAAALPGTGPFEPGTRGPGGVLLRRNDRHFRGRPFAEALEIRASAPRIAARQLERGEVHLALRAEGAGGAGAVALPALAVTVAVVNGAAPSAADLRGSLAGLDRADLARRCARGPAEPLATIVPPAILPGAPGAAPAGEAARPPRRVALLASAAEPDQRALAERIQVKLFDRGGQVSVDLADSRRFAARLRAGDFDVALVRVPIAGVRPALAAAQVALWTRGPAAALRALAALSGAPPAEARAAAERLGRELDLVPLVATGLRASIAPALQGLAPAADGGFDPGDLWLLGGGAR